MNTPYETWLKEHISSAKGRYLELCKLDDKEIEVGGTSAYYEEAHQMFGYIAALEKCLKQTKALSPKPAPKKAKKRATKAKN